MAAFHLWAFEVSRSSILRGTFSERRRVEISTRSRMNKREVFFHAHLAKTAGSTLNRAIARRYYGVCGIKGYSFSQILNDAVRAMDDPKFPGYGLDRVHPSRMSDWGFHNCALISHEIDHRSMSELAQSDFFEGVSKTLIIPCREPVDHFLSQCNHINSNFTALASKNCTVAISSCALGWERYNDDMLDSFDSVLLFKYDQFDELFDRLDGSLPKRVVPLKDTQYYRTNKDRVRINEQMSENCSWEALKEGLTHSWSYYKLCDKHLGKQKYAEVQREDILLK